MKQKVLITGMSGFVGPYLKEELEKKNYEVFGLSTSGNGFICDITNYDCVFNVINTVKPDYIFHLAGFSSVAKSFEQPELCFNVNVNGTKVLLDSVLEAKLNPKILIVSSSEIYGVPDYIPVNEKHKLKPISPYGKSRFEQEKLALSYNLDIIISRSFNHMGPGQQDTFVCSSFAKQVAEVDLGLREKLKVGDLSVVRSFADVRDIVKGYVSLLEKGEIKEIYNLGSEESKSIKDILDILISFSEKKIIVEIDQNKLRPAEIPELVCDCSKIKSDIGWSQKIKLSDTLKDMFEFWKENLQH